MKQTSFYLGIGSFIFATILTTIQSLKLVSIFLQSSDRVLLLLILGLIEALILLISYGLFKRTKLAYRGAVIVGVLCFIGILVSIEVYEAFYIISAIFLFFNRSQFEKKNI